jgi:hypothetical protein
MRASKVASPSTGNVAPGIEGGWNETGDDVNKGGQPDHVPRYGRVLALSVMMPDGVMLSVSDNVQLSGWVEADVSESLSSRAPRLSVVSPTIRPSGLGT